MRIECTEAKLSDTDAITGQHYQLKKGDQVEVHDDYGARLCRLGWAKDVAGKVKSGVRKPGPEVLVPAKMTVGARGRTNG